MSMALAAQISVSVGSLASVLLAGRRLTGGVPRFPRAPWLLLIASHGLFLVYALTSGQPGFLLLNVGMVIAGLVNLRAALRIAQTRREGEANRESETRLTPADRE